MGLQTLDFRSLSAVGIAHIEKINISRQHQKSFKGKRSKLLPAKEKILNLKTFLFLYIWMFQAVARVWGVSQIVKE